MTHIELYAGAQSLEVCVALCKISCKEVLPSRDAITHQEAENTHFSFCSCKNSCKEELSRNFPSKCFFKRKYNFLKVEELMPFHDFSLEKKFFWRVIDS